jgi:hypothetical protein
MDEMEVKNYMEAIKKYAGATGRDLHIDVPLTNLSVGFPTQETLAGKIFPTVPVAKESDKFYTWPREFWYKIYDAERSRAGMANRIDYDVSTSSYVVNNYALAHETPLEDLANADESLAIRESSTRFVANALLKAQEVREATLLLTTGNYDSTKTISANSGYLSVTDTNPVDDIDEGIEAIRTVTGLKPNKMIVSQASWVRLRKHPELINFVRGRGDSVGGGGLTTAAIANVFGLGEVLIGDSIKDTAGENSTPAYTDTWSNHIVLLHVADAPGKMVPTYGYNFQWRPQGFPAPFVVIRDRDDKAGGKHVETIEVMHFQDEKVVSSALGYLIIGA